LREELAELLKKNPERSPERIGELRELLANAAIGFRKSREVSLYYAQKTLDAIPAAPQNEKNEKLWRGVARCHTQDAERLLREAELAESPL
jgi:hypothetical protein